MSFHPHHAVSGWILTREVLEIDIKGGTLTLFHFEKVKSIRQNYLKFNNKLKIYSMSYWISLDLSMLSILEIPFLYSVELFSSAMDRILIL